MSKIFQRGGETQQQVVKIPPMTTEQQNGTLPALTGNFTADNSSNTFTLSSHGFSNGDVLRVSSDGTLPNGLSDSTNYFVIEKTDNTFKLSETNGGSETAISDNGTGTHSWTHQFREITLAKTSEELWVINKHSSNDLEVILPSDEDGNFNDVGLPLTTQYSSVELNIRCDAIRLKSSSASTTYHYTCFQE